MDPNNLIVLVAIILVILLVVYPKVQDRLFHARAAREGIIIEATVIRKEMNRSRTGSYPSLEYSYLDYERLEFVKRQAYELVSVGDQIKIVYLRSNPQDARIIDTRIKGNF